MVDTGYGTKRITKEFLQTVSEGLVPGYSLVHKFGRNSAVGTDLTPVCDGGFYRTPTASTTLEVLSDDADDAAAGAGAQEVTLLGLDANFNAISATVETDGTNAVTIDTDFMRLYRMYVSRSGTYATQTAPSQQGTITVREDGGGDTWATLPEIGTTGFAVGQSLIGAYTVPAGYTAYIMSVTMAVDSVKSCDMYFFARDNADDVTTPYTGIMRLKNVYVGVSGIHENTHFAREPYSEKTDIGYLAVVSTGTADVSVEFELLLKDNTI